MTLFGCEFLRALRRQDSQPELTVAIILNFPNNSNALIPITFVKQAQTFLIIIRGEPAVNAFLDVGFLGLVRKPFGKKDTNAFAK